MKQFLDVKDLTAEYENSPVVENVNFHLAKGELACLLGPSGCGKTTILNTICGFKGVKSGSIALDGKVLTCPEHNLPPEKRQIGLVFQDHALFPHLDIKRNIGFGLRGKTRQEKKQIVGKLLELIGLSEHRDKFPHELSGGQSQRVALARALAPQPKLLLMDEPFSNLDVELRTSLGVEIHNILKEQGTTAIMVTHDQQDAFALGDSIGVMKKGEIMQWGSAFELYHEPKSKFVANFVGEGVFVNGQMVESNRVLTSFGSVTGESRTTELLNKDVELLVRPDDVVIAPDSPIRAEVLKKSFRGAQTLYTLKLSSDERLLSLMPSHEDFELGDQIGVQLEPDHLVCFAAS
jgi:iron(III) transport system ATP-binding protein